MLDRHWTSNERLGPALREGLAEGAAYSIRPRNAAPLYQWEVEEGVAVQR